MRGLIVAGTHSGCGKTTVTLGIMAALRKKGLTVQPFKTGPDFIDAGLHKLAAGRTSRNLDQWMCGKEYVVECFRKHSSIADISVIEGVMGMYDGEFSTASVGALLDLPIILVVDAYGMAESVGAIVSGFAEFGNNPPTPPLTKGDTGGLISGVIFNRVASESHFQRLKQSVRDVPVFGYLPRELDFEIPHRHLGLMTAEDDPMTAANIDKLAAAVLRHIDIDALGKKCESSSSHHPHPSPLPEGEGARIRIAVAYDKAFCFYYEDNFDLLREGGAEIVFFSPLSDRTLPDGVDAVYIGGGYPELHAQELSQNASMLDSIRAWSAAGKPLYAECGGLMYLSKGIRDFENKSHAMAGLFAFEARMLRKPKLAYREIVLNEDCILGRQGAVLRGHEFHYSEIAQQASESGIYKVRSKSGTEGQAEGFRVKNTLASYIHVHFGSNPVVTEWIVKTIAK
jgi:cobyrinic acid a,c-diamide synthase